MPKQEAGFTLIEILVAMMVFSVALLELGRMQLVAIQVNAQSQSYTQAMYLAQEQVERFMGLPFDHVDLVDTSPTNEGVWTHYTLPNPPGGYTVTWEVDQRAGPPITKAINVTVAWQFGEAAKTTRLSYLKSKETY